MKRSTITRLAALAIVLFVGLVFIGYWHEELATLYFNSRVPKVTASLPRCDDVEVLLIADIGIKYKEGSPPKNSLFPIRPYGQNAKILNRITLKGADAEALANLWRSQEFDRDKQALCHDPVYAFRFYSGWRKTLETSVCFHCSNFCVDTAVGARWWGFDTSTPQAKQLLKRLQELLPVPAGIMPP